MDHVITMVLGISQQIRELREEQIRQGHTLALLHQGQTMKPAPISSSTPGWMLPVRLLGTAAAKYAVAIAMVDYLLKGGDALTFATTLLKLL